MTDFQNITIVELDAQRSHQADRALYDMYLRLSERPQAAWGHAFAEYWNQIIYNMTRRAHVEGQYLVIRCAPDEIEKYHKSPLQGAVTHANNAYRDYLLRQEQAELLARERETEEMKRLNELKSRLKFDQ